MFKFIFLSSGLILNVFNIKNKYLRKKKKSINLLINFLISKINKLENFKIVIIIFKYMYVFNNIYFLFLKSLFKNKYIFFWLPKFNYFKLNIKKYNYIKRKIRKRLLLS